MADRENEAHRAQDHVAKRILIVEDEFLIALEAMSDLAAAGYEVVMRADGLQGLVAAKRDHFDLIITDYMMPKMNGIDMIHAIRAYGYMDPIVLTSSISRDAVPPAPYDSFLSKPYKPRDICALADHFIAMHTGKSARRPLATGAGIFACVGD